MPPLHRVLADHDLGLLRLIAELWGLELAAGSQREAADELAARMLQPALAAEIIAALPAPARAGFDQLAREGRQLLAPFTRRYGDLRAMGPARRDRERPWANAPTASETLWYRGLVGRAFFDAGRGPEEFVFIPDDLRSLAYVAGEAEARAAPRPPGHPAAAPTPAATVLLPLPPAEEGSRRNGASPAAKQSGEEEPPKPKVPAAGDATDLDAAGDDAVTLLAYLQVVTVRLEGGTAPAQQRAALARFLRQPAALDLILLLLRQLGLAEDPGGQEPARLDPERVQPFLQASGPGRARRLAQAWRDTRDWNDLLRMPGLTFEGTGWRNDPQAARQAILALLAQVPLATWWSLESFVQAVKERQPDFQRPAGDYDSWYIRAAGNGAYLRGFENWDRVDGALVRWLIEQPLRWLGLVELAAAGQSSGGAAQSSGGAGQSSGGAAPVGTAFRLTAYGAALLGLAGWPEESAAESSAADATGAALLAVEAGGLVRAPWHANGYDRFQLARISDWLPPEPRGYPYRLTPASLARASRKGISAGRIVAFLERAAAGQPALPPLAGALRRWEQKGVEAELRETVVLRLKSAELLELLRGTPGLGELLGESLGPAAVEVRRGDLERLRQRLGELNILIDGNW